MGFGREKGGKPLWNCWENGIFWYLKPSKNKNKQKQNQNNKTIEW